MPRNVKEWSMIAIVTKLQAWCDGLIVGKDKLQDVEKIQFLMYTSRYWWVQMESKAIFHDRPKEE
jgi:hypothetical protein